MRNLKFGIIVLVGLIGCKSALDHKMESFHLNQVQLLDGPFLDAQQTDLDYILAMDADRLLAPYMIEAGLEPTAPKYGNWEGDGLSGHIGGHYVSALAMMYAATGDEQIKEKLSYMIDQLDQCQQANENGYLAGIPDGKRMWGEIEVGDIKADYFSLNGGWVPLYNIHKIFAGLRDAYTYAGSEKALEMWVKLSDWWMGVSSNLSDDQLQQMLKSEHGGFNEVFADLYDVTGEVQYLEMAKKLSHRVLLDPLLAGEDQLTGMHANTQIPKIIGYERVAGLAHDQKWEDASAFFWETVVENRTVAFGGNSVREHFHASEDFSSMVTSEQGPETCNTYNMMRLSKMLFESTKDTRYLDYYERAQFNHILSSQHPDGGFVYFTPARPRHYRVYSQPNQGMWCCVGSGLENHTKYGELIYSHAGDDLYVNLFISSSLHWPDKGLKLSQITRFPEDNVSTLKIELDKPKSFTLWIRKPNWLAGQCGVEINGNGVEVKEDSGYFRIERTWQTGDEVRFGLPMQTALEFLPDGSNWAAFVHGPIVMAAATDTTDLDGLWADDSRMGHVAQGRFYPMNEAPVLVGDRASLTTLSQTGDLNFSLDEKYYSEVYDKLTLMPFYKLHDARYMMYWQVTDSAGLEAMIAATKAEEKERIALKEITVDVVKPGEQQPEADHYFKGENTFMGYSNELYWRSGNGWFEYILKNPNREARYLSIAYDAPHSHNFEVALNGKILEELAVGQDGSNVWNLSGYDLKDKVVVRMSAKNGKSLPLIHDVRLMRVDKVDLNR